MARSDIIVPQSRLGHARNGLSHLREAETKADVVCALLNGMGGNLAPDVRGDFAKVRLNCYLKSSLLLSQGGGGGKV